MPTYRVEIMDGQPAFCKPLSDILSELEHGGALRVLSPLEYHTDQQRRWYKGVCLRGLAEWNGDTPYEWDGRLKNLCGHGLLKEEWASTGRGQSLVVDGVESSIRYEIIKRLTIVGVGKRNMTAFIEEILSKAIEMEWPVTPPDPELRRT